MIHHIIKKSALVAAILASTSPVWAQTMGSKDLVTSVLVVRTDRLEQKPLSSQDLHKTVLGDKESATAQAKAAKEKAKAEAKAAKEAAKLEKERAKAEAKAQKEAEKARKKAEKEARKAGKDLATAPEEKSKTLEGAFPAEQWVPLDQFLGQVPYKWTANKWQTQYTIYVPRVSLVDGHLHIDPNSKAEPLKLAYVLRPQVVKDQDGLETKSVKEVKMVDTSAFRLPVEGLEVPKARKLYNPVAWAFDPLTTEAHPILMHEGVTNIMSPSWFELQADGLKASPKITTTYVRTYRDKGYQVWPLITNQFDPTFTATILKQSSSGLWATYAQQLVQYALAYGFEGYNFDFENIHESHKAELTHFVSYLSDYLHQYGIRTSIDVTGYSTSEYWSRVYDRPALAKSVDYVVHMAYDEVGHSSSTAGPVASYPWVRKQTEQMLGEVPAEKLVLGIPFYTRIWTESSGYARSKTLTIADSRNYLKTYQDNVVWNDQLKGYTLTIPSHGLTKQETGLPLTLEHQAGTIQKIWFEDNKSLDEKLKLVNEFHLAGFAAWRKGFEDKGINDMIYQYPFYAASPQDKALRQESHSTKTIETKNAGKDSKANKK